MRFFTTFHSDLDNRINGLQAFKLTKIEILYSSKRILLQQRYSKLFVNNFAAKNIILNAFLAI